MKIPIADNEFPGKKLVCLFTNDFIFTLYVGRVPEIWSGKLLKKFFKATGHDINTDFLKFEVNTETLKEMLRDIEDGKSS